MYEELKAAIMALGDPGRVKEANRWLLEFERRGDSWGDVERLLHEVGAEGSQFRQYGGKLLHSKIQRDLELLPQEQVAQLTQSLLGHLSSLAARQPLERNVCRFVSLSIAALAVQMTQPGVVMQILQLIDPIIAPAPQLVLDLLTFLPEEADNRSIDVPRDQRAAFVDQLTASAESVFQFLLALWPQSNAETQCDILKCLSRWVSLTEIPWERLCASPMYSTALDCLTAPGPQFIYAADVLRETVARFDAHSSSGAAVMTGLLPRVLALRGVWVSLVARLDAHVDDDNEEIVEMCRSVANVFARVGKSYLSIIFSPADLGQAQIVAQMLDIARFKHGNNIAVIPNRFFYSLSEEIQRAKTRVDQDPALGPLITRYTPVFSDLLNICMEQVRLKDRRFEPNTVTSPTTGETTVASGAIKRATLTDEEDEVRTEYRETFVDCTIVLGGEVAMHAVCTSLQVHVSAANGTLKWADVECHLLGAQMIASYVPVGESAVLPWLLQFVSQVPDVGPIMGTVMELVGKLSRWLASNPQYLNHFLNQLGAALRSSYSCAPAARALKSILADCYQVPDLPIVQMHELLLETRAQGSLPLQADLDVIAGFRKVIINMPSMGPENLQGQMLQRLLVPMVAALATAITGTDSVSPPAVVPHLERLASALEYEKGGQANYDPQTLLPFFVQSVNILQTTLALSDAEIVAEKVCRVYKHCVRNCKDAFGSYIAPMCQHLTEKFDRKQHSAYIYAGSVLVSEFGAQPAHQAALYDMVWGLSRIFFREFSSLEQFVNKPDVVEEYYYFMVKVLNVCPGPMMANSADTATLIGAGISGLELEHREAQKGIVSFFDEVLRISLGRGAASSAPDLAQAAKALVFHYGPQLVAALVRCLSGQLPMYALPDNQAGQHQDPTPSVVELLFKLRNLGAGELQVCWFGWEFCASPAVLCGFAYPLPRPAPPRPSPPRPSHFLGLVHDCPGRHERACAGQRSQERHTGISDFCGGHDGFLRRAHGIRGSEPQIVGIGLKVKESREVRLYVQEGRNKESREGKGG